MKESFVIVLSIVMGGAAGHFLRLPSGILVGGLVAGLAAKGLTLGNVPSGSFWSVASQLLVAYVVVSNSDVGALRLRTVATKDQDCATFPFKDGDGYHPAVVLDFDYTVLMPTQG